MKIFTKYVIKEFLGPFLISVGVLTFIFLMDRLFLLVDLIVKKGVKLINVIELLAYNLPFVIAMTIPLSILSGAMMSFGRLSQDNEIEAMRTSGVGLFMVFKPLLLLNILIMFLMFFFDSFILPEANHRARNLLSDISRKKPTVRFEEGIFNEDFPGYTIYIGKKDEKHSRIYDIMIYQKKSKSPTLILAKEGKIRITPDEKYLQMILYHTEVHELVGDGYRRLKSDTQTINFLMNTALIRRERKYRTDAEMPITLLLKRIKKLKEHEKEMVKRIEIIKKKLKNEKNPRIKAELLRISSLKQKINRYLVEVNKMIVMPIAGIIFLYFGASLGVKLKKGGIGTAIVTSLIFFAVYYVLLLAGEDLGDRNKLSPFISIWLPNIFFIPLTFVLYHESFYEKNLLRWFFLKR